MLFGNRFELVAQLRRVFIAFVEYRLFEQFVKVLFGFLGLRLRKLGLQLAEDVAVGNLSDFDYGSRNIGSRLASGDWTVANGA